jgi:beta-xylosidase
LAYASSDLENWTAPFTVFERTEGFWGNQMIWAPEVHRYRGEYYLFVTFNSQEQVRASTPGWQPGHGAPLVAPGTQILFSHSPRGPFQPFRNRGHTPLGLDVA